MKRAILYSMLLIFLSGCAGSLPDWYKDRENYFPAEEYFVAEGWGATPDVAVSKAAMNLAQRFETRVSVEKNILQRYQSISDGKDFEEYIQEFSEETAKIIAGQNLINVLFVDPVYHRKSRTYYTLAYMQRFETAAILIERINRNYEDIEYYVRSAYSEKDPAKIYSYYNAAWLLSSHCDMMQQQLDILVPGFKQSGVYKTSDLYERSRTAARSVTFSMAPDVKVDERLYQSLGRAVNSAGFALVPGNGFFRLRADMDVRLLNIDRDPLKFVSWELRVNLLNVENEILLSFSRQGKEGSVDTETAALHAYNNAYVCLEEEFYREIEHYFDARVK